MDLRDAPTSVTHVDEALARHGDFARAYLDGMWVGDPLADAFVADFEALGRGRLMRQLRRAIRDGVDSVADAPDSLRALFAQLDATPDWVDLDLVDQAQEHVLRYARETGIVLGAASLLAGYANPTASRPLQLTGRYIESAGMRTVEVASWLRATTDRGGLRRDGLGFERTVRVRLIHAMVRHHLRHSPDWDVDAWGVPISQSHLAYTLDEFCLIPLRAVRHLGAVYMPHEIEGQYAKWRYLGHLLGVGAELLPATQADQERLEDLHLLTRPPMEEFCRDLVRGINTDFLVPEVAELLPRPLRGRAPWVVHGLERLFLGDGLADDLHLPPSRAGRVVSAAGAGLRPLRALANRSPAALDRATRAGRAYADEQDLRLRTAYAVEHELVDDSPDSGQPHPARVAG